MCSAVRWKYTSLSFFVLPLLNPDGNGNVCMWRIGEVWCLVFLQMVAQNRLRPHTIQTHPQQHYALKAVNYYYYYYSFRSLWSKGTSFQRFLWSESVH
jgi:hypothetical protein